MTTAYRRGNSGEITVRVHCIFAKLTNSNFLGKLPICDSNNRVDWKLLYRWTLQKYNIHARDGEGPDL